MNVIWQGDANSYCFRSFALCDSPAQILNVTGLKKLSVRDVAQKFGHRFGKTAEVRGNGIEERPAQRCIAMRATAGSARNHRGRADRDDGKLVRRWRRDTWKANRVREAGW